MRVVTLRGDDPTIEVPIAASWAPNVYVSVLALRGHTVTLFERDSEAGGQMLPLLATDLLQYLPHSGYRSDEGQPGY